jgi:C4-type Zn-finger protein
MAGGTKCKICERMHLTVIEIPFKTGVVEVCVECSYRISSILEQTVEKNLSRVRAHMEDMDKALKIPFGCTPVVKGSTR